MPIGGVRDLRKADMIHNGYTPRITVDPETYVVVADGQTLLCEPAHGAADGAALLPVLMLELDRRAPRDARAAATLTLPWERRGVTRQTRAPRRRRATPGLFLPRGEVLRGGDRVASAIGRDDRASSRRPSR